MFIDRSRTIVVGVLFYNRIPVLGAVAAVTGPDWVALGLLLDELREGLTVLPASS